MKIVMTVFLAGAMAGSVMNAGVNNRLTEERYRAKYGRYSHTEEARRAAAEETRRAHADQEKREATGPKANDCSCHGPTVAAGNE